MFVGVNLSNNKKAYSSVMEEHDYIKSFIEGNSRAFEFLFMKYQPGLVRFLAGLIHDQDIARDIASDLFVSLWNHRSCLQGVNSFSSYLYKMARNAVANYYEHLSVTNKYTLSELLKQDIDCSTEEGIFFTDLMDVIEDSLQSIPDRRRQVFVMSRIQGMSNDEISARLGISKKTVENHITMVLSQLRKVMKYLVSICF